MTEFERANAFNTVNYVPFRRVHPNQRGKKNENLNKCLQFLEVRSWERGGDCSFKNEDLSKLIGVSKRQITTYIKQLEEQGFITVLYHDIIKETPIFKLDSLTNQKIKCGVNKKRLTHRIIRCHRIIAKNGYKPPKPKVNPNCRKNKPFRNDFRPPIESINFNKIPLQVFEYSRLNNVFSIQNKSLEILGENEKLRYDGMKKCFKMGIGIEEGLKRGIVPPPIDLKEVETPSTFKNLYEQYIFESSDDCPIIYDFNVEQLYFNLKNKALIGDPDGELVLGKQYFTNPDLDVLPDHKVMYFNNIKSEAKTISFEDISRLYIEKLRNSDKKMIQYNGDKV